MPQELSYPDLVTIIFIEEYHVFSQDLDYVSKNPLSNGFQTMTSQGTAHISPYVMGCLVFQRKWAVINDLWDIHCI